MLAELSEHYVVETYLTVEHGCVGEVLQENLNTITDYKPTLLD